MPTDFEQRLRESLQARASQVTPNPETWNRVQEGIRREQRFRWVLAAAATAALVAVAVLVVPGLLTGSGVEFGPPEIAEQPGVTPTVGPQEDEVAPPGPGSVPPPVDVVVAASQDIGIIGPEVSHIVGSVPAAQHVAVHPASTASELDVVVAGDCELQWLSGDAMGASVEAIPPLEGACPAGPRFSPEGDHLAWIDDDGAGGFTLRTIGWDDGPQPARNAGWELDLSVLDELGVAALDTLRINEWGWRVSPDGEGVMALAGRDVEGVNRTFFLPVEQDGDGAVALPHGTALQADPAEDRRILSYQRTAAAAWSLELLSNGVVEVVRSDEGERLGTMRLSEAIDSEAADDGPVWMQVVDEVVILGDGRGRAWWTQWDGETFSALSEIAPDLGIVHGAALEGGGQEPQTPPSAETETELDAAEEPAEETTEAQVDAGLPAAVADTRQALLDAAASGDLENLRPLIPDDGFSFSFGASEDPIAYWRERQAAGEDVLGLIERLLELPHTEIGAGTQDPTMYVWPFAFDRPYESLSSAELVLLEEAIGPDGMASYQESGQYLDLRVGIEEDGTWRYFVAGD